jgi:hypothetical protein
VAQHGGKRPGAGRKVGTANKRTREIAQAAAAEGITPIQVLLHHMRAAHVAGNVPLAVDCATRASPYTHPKLAAVVINMKDLSDDQLRSVLNE